MSRKRQTKNEDQRAEAELDDEQLEGVAGGSFVKSWRAIYGGAGSSDQAVTMTAIALAESGGGGS